MKKIQEKQTLSKMNQRISQINDFYCQRKTTAPQIEEKTKPLKISIKLGKRNSIDSSKNNPV
jgi:hypothetical protein